MARAKQEKKARGAQKGRRAMTELMKEGKVAFLQDYVARKKKEELHHEQRSSTEPVR